MKIWQPLDSGDGRGTQPTNGPSAPRKTPSEIADEVGTLLTENLRRLATDEELRRLVSEKLV